MAGNVKTYYDYNMPQGEYVTGYEVWTGAAPTGITIQPGTDEAIFVGWIKMQIDNTFAMSVGDIITITINAYDNTSPQTITMTGTAVVGDDLAVLISWGDPDLYEARVIGVDAYHSVVIKMKPAIYLRSSTAPAESVTIEYTNVGGGITAGSMIVSYEGWKLADEDDSGLS